MADVNWQRSLEKLLRFDNLEKRVQTHLKNVYSCLSMAMLAAAAGGYVHLYTNLMQASLLTVFASIGLILALAFTPHSPENQTKRLAYLVGFGFFSGMGLGPLMDVIIRIDPSIIPTAFLGTTLIFVSFTLSALLGNQRKWLYLGVCRDGWSRLKSELLLLEIAGRCGSQQKSKSCESSEENSSLAEKFMINTLWSAVKRTFLHSITLNLPF